MRTWVLVCAVIVGLLSTATPALGAWGGQPDGGQHPMVGAIYADFDGSGQITWDESFCSGSYAGPSRDGRSEVFLTAAHCLAWLPVAGFDTVYVSFDADPQETDGVPEGLIATADFAWDQRFDHDMGNLYDSAVVLLPAGSVTGITPVQLPPLGYLDQLNRSGQLKGMRFEMVGYGVVPLCWGTDDPPEPCAPAAWLYGYDGLRRTSQAPVKALTKAWLLFNMNTNASGLGGVCYGDSGSPQFVPGTTMIVSTTTGGDSVCRAHNYDYRLDTLGAREFLGAYLSLP